MFHCEILVLEDEQQMQRLTLGRDLHVIRLLCQKGKKYFQIVELFQLDSRQMAVPFRIRRAARWRYIWVF
jgi:hypothetical protein